MCMVFHCFIITYVVEQKFIGSCRNRLARQTSASLAADNVPKNCHQQQLDQNSSFIVHFLIILLVITVEFLTSQRHEHEQTV